MTGVEPDPRLVAIARQLERADRRLSAVEQLVRELAADVTALTDQLDPTEPDPVAMRSWLTADDLHQACGDLTELIGWLRTVYLRFTDAQLPSCWLWHPAVVEELWWLHRAHTDAYTGPAASWTRVADWHDRLRPGVARRIRDAVGICELALHVPGGQERHPALDVPLAEAAEQQATWWTTEPDRPAPAPTDHQLDQAQRHDDTRTTTHRPRNHPR